MKVDGWVLEYDDGIEVWAGDIVQASPKDVPYIVQGGRPPHKPSSSGHVYVTHKGVQRMFFPRVFNLKWVKQ